MKLTKEETKNHDAALDLLKKETLTEEDRDFIFENFHPGASNNIGKAGIFFTPFDMARDLAVVCGAGGRILDGCAGIGVLSYKMTRFNAGCSIVAVEINPEFVKIGRKLLPEVEWVCGDIFNRELVESLGLFDCGISNPPFGYVATTSGENAWLKYTGPAHLQVAEILLRRCRFGAKMIIPDSDHSQEDRKNRQLSKSYNRFIETFPGARIVPDAVDPELYLWKAANPKATIVDLSGGDPENVYFDGACGKVTAPGNDEDRLDLGACESGSGPQDQMSLFV